jgi:gliding motility-associated-like protein
MFTKQIKAQIPLNPYQETITEPEYFQMNGAVYQNVGGVISLVDSTYQPVELRDGNGTLGPVYSNSACGLNFVQVSQKVTTRYATPVGSGLPVTLNVTGIPACFQVEQAYLWWTVSGSVVDAGYTITNPLGATLNTGSNVVGTHVPKCWGEGNTYVYRANVTANITGNGNYQVNLNSGVWGTDGVTLMVIYRDLTATYTGNLYIRDGAITIPGGNTNHTLTFPAACQAGTNTRAFSIVADMQDNVAANHPCTLNGQTANYPNNFYNFNQSTTTVVNAGQTTANYGFSSGGDCYTWSVAGLYFQTNCVVCTPSGGSPSTASVTPTTICSGQTVTLNLTPAATGVQWQSAPNIGGPWTNIGGATTNSYTTGPLSSNTCFRANHNTTCGVSPSNVVCITVNPLNTVTGPGTATTCVNTPITAINHTTTGATGIGTPTGLPAGVTATFGSNTITISGTPTVAGTFNYSIPLTGGCGTVNATGTITVNPVPTVTPGSNSPICVGQTLNLTVNATAGATYSWTGPNGFSSTVQNPSIPAATAAASGTYTVTVTANGCSANNTVNALVSNTFNSTITPAGPFCTTDAAVNLTAVDPGGTWSGTGITNATAGTFDPSVAGAGTHTITYTIPGACGSSSNTNITVNPQPTVTPGSNSPVCTGQTINLTVNATAGATYSWTGPNGFNSTAQNPSIAAATAADTGTYTITVTANGCTNSNTVNVVVNNTLNSTITPVGPFCASNANTFLAAVDPGGTWSGPGIVNATTGEFSPTTAGAGTHTITYTITGACGSSSTTNIQVIADADATINPAGPFCITDAAVNLTAVQAGGVWSGTGITSAAMGTFDPSVAGAGTHTITYTISGVCGDMETINITVNAQLPSTITPVGPFCVNAASITLQGASPGGTWSGTGITNPATGTFDPSVAGAGIHTITYTTPGNCGTSSTINITVNALPQISFAADVTNGCLPLTVNFSNNSNPQGVNCVWSINGVPANNSCASFTHTFTQPGCYNIGLQTTDGNGCSNSQTLNNYVCVSDVPQAAFSHSPTNATVLDPTVYFTNESTGADTYFWDFGGLGNSTQMHPSFTFPTSGPQTYVVCLTASNNAGCVDDVCENVIIYDEFLVYAPNAFTPTGDGINDVFIPIVSGHDILSYELMIFNRWGEMIFQTDVSSKGWDGSHKAQPAKEDVYVWKLKVKRLSDGKKFEFTGHVTLLR